MCHETGDKNISIIIAKMIDLDRHKNCPIWNDQQLNNPAVPWTGMRYACLKVLQAYCKVFDREELYDVIVRYIIC